MDWSIACGRVHRWIELAFSTVETTECEHGDQGEGPCWLNHHALTSNYRATSFQYLITIDYLPMLHQCCPHTVLISNLCLDLQHCEERLTWSQGGARIGQGFEFTVILREAQIVQVG